MAVTRKRRNGFIGHLAHTAYLAGSLVKRNFVDNTMYYASSMLRTMELIPGLPPMSQYDATATPMWRCLTATANTLPFKAAPANVYLDESNKAVNASSKLSETFDFLK